MFVSQSSQILILGFDVGDPRDTRQKCASGLDLNGEAAVSAEKKVIA